MLKRYDKVKIDATWWLRKPIPSEMISTGYIGDHIWMQSENEFGFRRNNTDE